MIQPLKHQAVNWVDGMKISQKHFTAHDNYINDSLRDVASYFINKHNFGLLPIEGIEDPNSIFEIYNSATNDVQLHIKKCHAVTPNGFRIAISNMKISINALAGGSVETGLAREESYFVLITVNPMERVPDGEFDPEETPPRHLYTQPKCHVQLVPANATNDEHLSSGNYIIAGRVYYNNGMINVDTSFVPPCTTVSSHPVLLKYHSDFARSIAGLQQFASRIIQKNHYKNQNAVVAGRVRQLCEAMLHHFADHYFSYRNVVHQQPPVYMIDVFAKLAHNLYSTLDIMPHKEKEEMLNYCSEWSEIPPHTLLNQLSAVVEINYNHYKNGEYLRQIEQMLNSLFFIWEKLSGLEYIGQQKENIIVKEEVVSQIIKEKKGWNIVD